MSTNNLNTSVENSTIKKIKKRSALKKQRLAIVLMIIAVALLVLTLIVVNYLVEIYTYPDVDGTKYYIKKFDGEYMLCNKSGKVLDRNQEGYYQTDAGTQVIIDAKTGEYSVYAVVDVSGTEEIGYAQYVLMFPQWTYDASSTKDKSKIISSIEVHNEYGTYTFKRPNEKSNFFEIVGNEDAPYDVNKFAYLSSACGYTLSTMRLESPLTLEDGSVDLSEYGLVAQTRVDEETGEEYEYAPAWFVITNMKGVSHKVIIGDATVDGSGYYALYEGRETIYVLTSYGLDNTVLKGIESMITPTIVYPMGLNTHFDVSDFIIYRNIDHEAIQLGLEAIYGTNVDNMGEIDAEEFWENYISLMHSNSSLACHFSYVPLKERVGMYQYLPYVSELEYAEGYYINSDNISNMLYNFYDTAFTEVIKLSPDNEDLEKYGLADPTYVISFDYNTADEKGDPMIAQNFIQISEKTADGVYYAYSDLYDMIVGISESSLYFLEWDEIEWYSPNYIQLDIGHVSEIVIESPKLNVNFVIEDSASKYMIYSERTGSKISEGDNVYSIVKGDDGKYVLKCNGENLVATYSGDYLITPLVYSPGVAETDKYLFVETSDYDINDDGKDDATAYYFYNIAYDAEKGFYLYAGVSMADAEGNVLASDVVVGKSHLKTDYFITNSGYLYMTSKNSHVGKELNKKYASHNRGNWATGNVFVTVDGKYMLVNSKTGEWSILDDLSSGIYFADSKTSLLAKSAVEIEAKYGSNGNLTRYPETYYPLSEKKLQYNEENGTIQAYDSSKKAWAKATYKECTIGVWNTGSYYVTEGGNIIVVNEETGSWGVVTLASNETYVAKVIANGKLLDYTINATNSAGREVVYSAMKNFQQVYGSLLYASLEGMAELSEEEMAAFRALDDSKCQAVITIYGKDLYGNERNTVYRFYQYTERKSYITIESISYDEESGEYVSDSEKAYGSFYVLRSYIDKIIADAQRVLDGEEVTSVSKY
ncbi:MAG: hypothetical protein E7592_00475 [Ruminococcaceae bacterium]|nr:hypothetical protein [Oscillospiraceae bacterium]